MPDRENEDLVLVVPSPGMAPEDPLSRTAVTSFFWAFSGFVGNRVVVFVSTLVLARLLVPEDFGVVAASLVLLSFTTILMDLGLGAAIVQEQEHGFSRRLDTAVTAQMMLASAFALLLFLFAPQIAAALGIADHAVVLRVMAVHPIVRALGQTHEALLRRDMRFRSRAKVNLLQAGVRLVVSVALAMSGAGVWALVAGTLASESASTLANWVIVRYRPRPALDRRDLASLVNFGGAVTILQVVAAAMASVDYIVIGNRLGPVALGLYVMAFRLPELAIGSVLAVFSNVAFPVLSRARSRNMDQVRSGVRRSLQLAALFGFTTGAGLAVVSTDAVRLLFGPEWAPSATPLSLIAVSMGVGAVGFGVGDVYLAMGRPWLRLRITGSIVVPMCVAMYLAAGHGIVAVAWVHLGAAVTFASAELVLACRIIELPPTDVLRSLSGPLAAGAAIVLVTVPLLHVLEPGAVRLAVLVAAGVVSATAGAHLADRELIANVVSLLRTRAR